MSPSLIACKLLPPVATDLWRWIGGARGESPSDEGGGESSAGPAVPWSDDYIARWRRLITQSLADRDLLQRFRSGTALPAGYGVGIDERCVEYPWTIGQLAAGPQTMLDAGSALNHPFMLDHPLMQEKVVHIMTLAPEANCYWKKRISYLYCDLRDSFVRDGHYDTIVCLSTLEHVGCDNTYYTGDTVHSENRPDDALTAMRELGRMLKRGGTLLLTVPFGVGRHFGTFCQFDLNRLRRALEAFGPVRDISESFYRYTAGGWQLADAEACAECEYVEWVARPHDQWPQPLPVEPDLAAAARAVACVWLMKD